MRRTITFIIIFLFIIVTPYAFNIKTAKAWGPITHIYICEMAIQEIENSGQTSTLYEIIKNNYEWFKCGLMYPDVTVLYYYTDWKSYQFTHSWHRQALAWNEAKKAGSQRAMAFALGWGAHLLQDSIVHNSYIPRKIKETLVQNNIIHPIVEGIVETKVISYFPPAEEMAKYSFNLYNVPFGDGTSLQDLSPVRFAEQVTGAPPEFEQTASQFFNILSGGGFGAYSFKGYAFKVQRGPLWDLYHFVASAIQFALSDEDPKPYLQQTIEATKKWILEGSGDNPSVYVPSTYDSYPTGEMNLKEADAYVSNVSILVVVCSIIVITVYYYRKYRRGKT